MKKNEDHEKDSKTDSEASMYSLKPMNCLTGDSSITLYNDINIPLSKLKEHEGLRTCGITKEKNIKNTHIHHFLAQGKKDCHLIFFIIGVIISFIIFLPIYRK